MLAKEYNWTRLSNPFIAQPKLRGIRGVLINGIMYSRDEKVLHLLSDIFPKFPYPLDGEIYKHNWTQHRIYGAVMRNEKNADTDLLEFHVFDAIIQRTTFEDRFVKLYSYFKNFNHRMQLVETLRTAINPDNIYHDFLSQDYEGVIYRDPMSFYLCGTRSWGLMKRKPFEEDEATIIAVKVSKTGKRSGLLKHFVCKWKDGVEIRIGGGNMTDEMLYDAVVNPKVIGRRLMFKYEYLSHTGLPQCPTFVKYCE